uniref:Probable transcription factor claV n=1 Tax=Ampulloclitocybe clavipes TaxID=56467 RepID=CLAV_AMPCV
MPPRPNKRQQREQEELESLGGPSHEGEVSSEDEVAKRSVKNIAGAGFAALLTPEEDGQDSGDAGSPQPTRKTKKKKKKGPAPPRSQTPVMTEPPQSSRTSPNIPVHPKNEKKATKKAKAREKKAGKDELDKALAELSVNEAEMRKFFGAKVVQANKSTSAGASGSSSRRKPGVLRSNLTHPQPSWWAAKQREGLSIRVLTESETEAKMERQKWDTNEEEKWWTVEYSKKYKSMTMAFMQTVMSGDPEGFWNLLGKLPWHADTLLQLSEVYRHREEYAQAMDFVDRALFTYERSFIGAFTFTSGLNRLDFDHVENRPFFLAIHRQATDLQRRGCVRTAFEFARLLYSLDPWNDPHGALFHLDFLALKAGMSQWLLDVFDLFAARKETEAGVRDSRLNPSLLPGWSYARALALRIDEDANKDGIHTASTSALIEAITSFPSVVPLLADKLDVSLPTSIRSHRNFRIETDSSSLSPSVAALHLLSHLYVQRSFSLWKDAAHCAWFSSTVTSTFSSVSSVLPTTDRHNQFLSLYSNPSPQYSAYRHIMVLEASYRRLFSFIPRHVLNAKSLACDPLPPPTTVTEYNQAFFAGTDDLFALRSRTRQERVADERRLERLIPDAAFRGQLQAFFEAHPNFAERFPGGIVQFAQIAGQLPEDVLEDMMLAEAMGGEGLQDGGMPGQMPGFADFMNEGVDERQEPLAGVDNAPIRLVDHRQENLDAGVGAGADEDDEVEDDDEDEDEEVAPMPVRVLRNLLGRFWGGNTVAEDSSDDEGDRPPPVDDGGVD